MRKRGAIVSDYLGWILIALAVLVIALVGYFILTGKIQGAIEYVKYLFRYGG